MERVDPGESPEDIQALRQKKKRRKGLVLQDEAILRAMEHYDDEPQYLPVQCKKDGLTGDLATPAQLAALERFVTGQVAAMIDEILSGKTQPNPVDRGPADSACRWCDYSSACHKDVCAVSPRRFAAVKADEFWQEIERRQRHG